MIENGKLLDLKEGTLVKVDGKAYGLPDFNARVRGFSTIPMSVVGRGVIVEPCKPIPSTTFSCVCINECNLTLLDKGPEFKIVGTAQYMPHASAFTMVAFESTSVPPGTEVYVKVDQC